MKPFFLNGAWVETPASSPVHNPWSGEKLADVCVANSEQVAAAVASCHAAFAETRKMTASVRSLILDKICSILSKRRDEFAVTIREEAGKPVSFAEVEADRAISTFRFASALALADGGHGIAMDASAPGAGHFGLVRRFPLGVILGITPFNFPLNLVAHKIAPCLATGNTMILKPALKTPLTALLLAGVLEEAGVPPGQINVVPFDHGHIPPLLADPRIKMLSFTGSAEIGWKLKSVAARKKITLELGGNAAVIVEPDADWRAAIPKIAAAAYGYAGQSCVSVQRIFVHKEIYAAFRDGFAAYVAEKIACGDPALRGTVVGPMINSQAREKILSWLRKAEVAGARILLPLRTEGASFLAPVLLENVPSTCEVVREEAFAPLAVLKQYDTFGDALAMVNDSPYGLQAGLFTSDLRKTLRAFEELEVGGVLIGQVPSFRVENMPYGGIKDSGFGREGLRYAMEEMTEPRSLIINGK